jgi:two-component system, cell cycle sensor histidine kinase and response regulator CckA
MSPDVRFQTDIIDAVQQAIVVVDHDDRVTGWNRFAESLYGWARDSAMGRRFRELVQFDLIDANPHSTEIEIDQAVTTQLLVHRRDGSTFVASVTSSPLHDSKQQQRGRVIVARDLTAEHALEEQVRHAHKMEAIGRLAGGVAHDFNNLLTVILAHAEFMRRGGPGAPNWGEDVDQITEAAQRATALTRQLLAFGRKQLLSLRTVDVNVVVEGIAAILEDSFDDVRLELSLDPTLPSIHADAGQLEQVVINLANNARDAMPGGGTVSVKTFVGVPSAVTSIHRTGESPANFVALSVCDSGVGMDAQTSARMFEPFFTTKDSMHGAGLGLSMVYGIVKQSGGMIDVETAVGGGTTITVYLPIAREHERRASVSQELRRVS